MQRIYIALALALTVSIASAGFTAENWVKAPAVVVQDNETDYSNRTGAPPMLGSANPGELTLYTIYTNTSAPPTNTSAWSWSAVWKKIDNKALTTSNLQNATFTQPQSPGISNGYAITIITENVSNVSSALRIYQTPLNGGGALATIQVSAPANYIPAIVGGVETGKTKYIFYSVADKKINFTSFTVGSATLGTEYTLATTIDTNTLQLVWGEALGNSQALALWREGDAWKEAVVDLSKGTSTPATVTGALSNFSCSPYSTDKKIYGQFCQIVDNGTLKTYVKTNSTGVVAWSSYQANMTSIERVEPYGEYLAVFLSNVSAIAGNPKQLSYEIWNLATLQPTVARKNYLALSDATTTQPIRIPAGGIYNLIYTIGGANYSARYQSIQVGQVLSGSYLTAILGFVMTIVAGLFLF